MISTVFFDAAGTLFEVAQPVGSHYADIAKEFGGTLDPGLADEAFRENWKAAPAIKYAGERDADRIERKWWQALVFATLDRLPPAETAAIDRPAYFDALFDSYESPSVWVIYPEVVDVLDALADQGLQLGVISNFDSRLHKILEGLGIADRFGILVHSGGAGSRKPERKIFDHAVALADTRASDCLHVGDDPIADWQGARDAGLKVFELDRPVKDLRKLPVG